jgi:hypothetical protein
LRAKPRPDLPRYAQDKRHLKAASVTIVVVVAVIVVAVAVAVIVVYACC